MKNDEDFTIQELFDRKMQGEKHTTPQMDAEDLEAYEVLYGHLNKKSEQGLPLSFKSDVLRRIAIEKMQANDSKFYWLLAVISLIGILVITSLSFVFKDEIIPSLDILNRFKGFVFIGIIAMLLFTFVERKSSERLS